MGYVAHDVVVDVGLDIQDGEIFVIQAVLEPVCRDPLDRGVSGGKGYVLMIKASRCVPGMFPGERAAPLPPFLFADCLCI